MEDHILNKFQTLIVAPLISENDEFSILKFVFKHIKSIANNKDLILNYPEADVVKKLIYDTSNQFDLNNDFPALTTIEYKREEDPYLMSGIEHEILNYLELDIYKHTGLSLKEYLNLPIREADTIADMVLVKIDKLNKQMEGLEKNIKESIPEEIRNIQPDLRDYY